MEDCKCGFCEGCNQNICNGTTSNCIIEPEQKCLYCNLVLKGFPDKCPKCKTCFDCGKKNCYLTKCDTCGAGCEGCACP